MRAGQKTVTIRLNVWANSKSGHIHLTPPDGGVISTVSNDPRSKRYHFNLIRKRVVSRQ